MWVWYKKISMEVKDALPSDLPIALRRAKRQREEVNYKEESFIKLPKSDRIQQKTKLYPVTVQEEKSEGDRAMVKIHYVGYSSEWDEWRYEGELESLNEENADTSPYQQGSSIISPYQPYSIYNALRVKIKCALNCGQKVSPIIKISMPFDLIQFNGGLKTVGIPSKMVCNIQHYGIKHYQDLDPFLGSFWHYRGLNVNGDYGYVQLDTVSFFLRKSRSLVEYFPPSSDSQPPSKTVTHTGHTLSFSFVCKYGIGSTFGKDKQIFV